MKKRTKYLIRKLLTTWLILCVAWWFPFKQSLTLTTKLYYNASYSFAKDKLADVINIVDSILYTPFRLVHGAYDYALTIEAYRDFENLIGLLIILGVCVALPIYLVCKVINRFTGIGDDICDFLETRKKSPRKVMATCSQTHVGMDLTANPRDLNAMDDFDPIVFGARIFPNPRDAEEGSNN